MAAVRIAQASSSEYFSAWGEPPNQRRTGATKKNPGGNLDGELNIMPWYRGPWTIRWRTKDYATREKIAWMAERAVANGSFIGYGQNNGNFPRTGVFDELQRQGDLPDPGKISRLCNCDCSSLVGAIVYHAGVHDPELRTMWTGSQEIILDRTGAFEKSKTDLGTDAGLMRGDILFKPGHTIIVLDSSERLVTVPYVITNCYRCNLRSGPSVNHKVIRELKPGEIVELINFADNGWGQVFAGKDLGYVSSMYLADLKTERASKDAWLRTGPGVTNPGIKVIWQGDYVYLTGETEKVNGVTWKKVIYDGSIGWASGRLV